MREALRFLGSTPTVARKSYAHRSWIGAFETGELPELPARRPRIANPSVGESLVSALLSQRSE